MDGPMSRQVSAIFERSRLFVRRILTECVPKVRPGSWLEAAIWMCVLRQVTSFTAKELYSMIRAATTEVSGDPNEYVLANGAPGTRW